MSVHRRVPMQSRRHSRLGESLGDVCRVVLSGVIACAGMFLVWELSGKPCNPHGMERA